MGRPLRVAPGGYVYHVLNRANARLRIFHKDGDYAAFERVLAEALERVPGIRLLAYCLMPNHWHLLVRPRANGELSDFCRYLTLTHTQRWHALKRHAGTGHLYQGRFKSFPVAPDDFRTVCRYVESNALRAGLVERAEDWRWGSLWRRQQADQELLRMLSAWPVAEPRNWLRLVNQPQSQAELEKLRTSVQRGRPYGDDAWAAKVAKKLGLESTLRPRGRPKKHADGADGGS
jgi:putative transposase